jgi:5'-phosphate synthase pdxT subunit
MSSVTTQTTTPAYTLKKLRIGVLGLQGDFEAHLKALHRAAEKLNLDVEGIIVKLPQHLSDLDGIILPGGESTTIGKLMELYGLKTPLQELISQGVPVWGTCAGLILLARETDNALAGQPLLASMNIRVCRNAFGSQRESFETDLSVPELGEAPFHAFFIRGPSVETVGPEVQVLATLDDGTIVAFRQGPLLGTARPPARRGSTDDTTGIIRRSAGDHLCHRPTDS